MKRLATLFLLLLLPLHGADEIVIPVSTGAKLLPIYVASWTIEGKTPPTGHLKEVMGALTYDLSHLGKTRVVPNSKERNEQARRQQLDKRYWQAQGIHYLVIGQVSNSQLSLILKSVNTGSEVAKFEIALGQEVAHDRKSIHYLADALYEEMFKTRSVASTHLLYTVRYLQPDGSYLSEIWESDWDGKGATRLTDGTEYVVTPAYLPSPQGRHERQFVYVSYTTGQPKIYQSDRPDRLSPLRGNQLMPACNLSASQLAFISDAGGNADLFVQDYSLKDGLVGKPRQLFTAHQATQASPTFSPDGRQIAFVSNKDGTTRIYLIDVENPKPPIVLSTLNPGNTSPTFSPDGTKVAYSAKTNGIRQIWYYDFLLGKEVQVTEGPGHKENPCWAPDSLNLVYNSANKDICELYTCNINQKGSVKISSGPGEKRFPSWQPLMNSSG